MRLYLRAIASLRTVQSHQAKWQLYNTQIQQLAHVIAIIERRAKKVKIILIIIIMPTVVLVMLIVLARHLFTIKIYSRYALDLLIMAQFVEATSSIDEMATKINRMTTY